MLMACSFKGHTRFYFVFKAGLLLIYSLTQTYYVLLAHCPAGTQIFILNAYFLLTKTGSSQQFAYSVLGSIHAAGVSSSSSC